MKTISISANSWHYKFINFMQLMPDYHKLDSCSYNRAFIKSVISALFVAIFFILVLTLFGVLFTAVGYDIFGISNIYMAIAAGFAAVAATITTVGCAIWAVIAVKKAGRKTIEGDSSAAQLYRNLKEKMCSKVEIDYGRKN